MFSKLWERIPGNDLVNKVSFVSAILGIIGFGLYFYDKSHEDNADKAARDQVIRLANELLGKIPPANAAVPPNAQVVELLATSDQVTQVKLGDQELKLSPPGGHCFLDPSQPGDARLIGALNGMFSADLRMLSGYADCAQLKLWRTGQRKVLDDHGQYLVPVSVLNFTYTGDPAPLVSSLCSTMRQEGESYISAADQTAKQRLKEALEGAALEETRYLGIVGEDKHACYFGIVQKLKTEFGDPKTQLGITAIIFAGGKVFTSNLYSLYTGDLSVAELIEKQKANVARISAANP